MWYHALKGWWKWRTGPRATAEEQLRRLTICAACDRVEGIWVDEDAAMKAATIAFGRPVTEALVAKCGECECLLGVETDKPIFVSVKGYALEPAGKPEAEEERCPLQQW